MSGDLQSELQKISSLHALSSFLQSVGMVEGIFGGRKYTKNWTEGSVTLNAITRKFDDLVAKAKAEGGDVRNLEIKQITHRILELSALPQKSVVLNR